MIQKHRAAGITGHRDKEKWQLLLPAMIGEASFYLFLVNKENIAPVHPNGSVANATSIHLSDQDGTAPFSRRRGSPPPSHNGNGLVILDGP